MRTKTQTKIKGETVADPESQLQSILMQLLPADHSAVGNITLWEQFQTAANPLCVIHSN